jgi:nitroreductase
MEKPAETVSPVLDVVRRRWSPVAFAEQPIDTRTLQTLFDAARWAASSYNEQPWRFIVASKTEPEAFAKALACLHEFNQAWAQSAAVLVFPIVKPTFTHNNKPNGVALYDVGQAVATLSLQAMALGIFCHQMAGILPDNVRSTYAVPADFEPATAVALGYPFTGDPASLSEDLRKKQLAPRGRKPFEEFVFAGSWGQPVPGLGS